MTAEGRTINIYTKSDGSCYYYTYNTSISKQNWILSMEKLMSEYEHGGTWKMPNEASKTLLFSVHSWSQGYEHGDMGVDQLRSRSEVGADGQWMTMVVGGGDMNGCGNVCTKTIKANISVPASQPIFMVINMSIRLTLMLCRILEELDMGFVDSVLNSTQKLNIPKGNKILEKEKLLIREMCTTRSNLHTRELDKYVESHMVTRPSHLLSMIDILIKSHLYFAPDKVSSRVYSITMRAGKALESTNKACRAHREYRPQW
ncbi:hypothetical protein L6452_27155 [Arctium lappa]|uniref:Uncharacterized protein n=1 Tax=Arctium lappa TaxID=4217 RepID=A0ACB8ZW70_ARCLA|nr:hypothetical protein L6452_27155 [Arctium lappa]